MGEEQAETPLWHALQAWRDADPCRAHVPAHRGGPGARRVAEALGAAVAVDATELPDLDDLFAPRGPILAAQRLAADLFGADEAFFLVGGSTAGILALMWACLGEGDEVLMGRDAHRSLMAGLALTGARARYLMPPVDAEFGLPLGLSAAQVRDALARWPHVRAVWVTYPTYHGVVADLPGIVAAAHAHGVPVLVDGAHGAHFGLHPELPPNPLAVGADAAVLGVHKTGGSLTQSAVLVLRHGPIDRDRVEAALRLWQSSSPSYLLLASLDLARAEMARGGRRAWGKALAAAGRLRRRCRAPVFEPERGAHAWQFDPTKVTVRVGTPERPAIAVAEDLWRIFRVGVEYADLDNLLLIVGPGCTEEEERRAGEALAALGGAIPAGAPRRLRPWPQPQEAVSPRRALQAPARRVAIEEAVGCVSAGIVAPSPPGIPLLTPGERCTAEAVAYLAELWAAGVRCQGVDERGRIAVVEEGALR